MTILLTGAAGFIGMHVGLALLERGETVVGLDNLNDYYPTALKQARLKRLEHPRFRFARQDVADRDALSALAERSGGFQAVIHLAAQAGVRHSLEQPFAYSHSNVTGQLAILELMRRMPDSPLIYASSSSVYGANAKLPWSVEDRVDHPVSLYAATKRAGELLTQSYAHLYGIRASGLRFFTVYGPWGRPDMAPWKFTRAIEQGEMFPVYNHGQMQRDFTYIDDITAGVLAALDNPAPAGAQRLYNLGNHQPVALLDFIRAIEQATGKTALMDMQPLQPGDVLATYADITESRRDLGFKPRMDIGEGMRRFVEWYQRYHG